MICPFYLLFENKRRQMTVRAVPIKDAGRSFAAFLNQQCLQYAAICFIWEYLCYKVYEGWHFC